MSGQLPYGLETIKPGAVRSMTSDKLASFSLGGTKKTPFQKHKEMLEQKRRAEEEARRRDEEQKRLEEERLKKEALEQKTKNLMAGLLVAPTAGGGGGMFGDDLDDKPARKAGGLFDD